MLIDPYGIATNSNSNSTSHKAEPKRNETKNMFWYRDPSTLNAIDTETEVIILMQGVFFSGYF